MPQSLSQLYVHPIFSTKHREPMSLSLLRGDLHAYLAAVLNNQDSPALKVGGMSDHLHALFRFSKKIALAKIVEEVKTGSSKWVKMQGRGLANFHWQSDYGAFSVSAADVQELVEYIAQQKATIACSVFKRDSGSCRTRMESPTTSGTCEIEWDCSAPSGLGFDGGFADPGRWPGLR